MHHPSVHLSERFLARVNAAELPPAVVLGTGVTGLTIARALTGRGIPVIGIDEEQTLTSRSRAFHFLPFPAFYEPEVIDFLDALAAALPRKAVLFCSGDEHVLLLSQFGDRLRERYHFELPEPENVHILMNKHRFAEVARERGWLVPTTHYCESVEEVEAILPQLSFPVILKPHLKNRQTRMHSPQKSFRCETAAELLSNYRLQAQWEKEVVIQQWIPGGDDRIFFSFHYFDREMNELASFEGKKIRQHLPECGSTSCAVGVEGTVVGDLSREILQSMESVGFCSVEYKQDPRDGRFYIMEPTVGRVNLQVGVAIANGVDLVSRGYFHLIGKPFHPQQCRTHHVKWILVPHDLMSARFYVRRGDLSWKEYFESISGPKVIAPLHVSDYPLLASFFSRWSLRAARFAGKKAKAIVRPGRGVTR